MLDGLGGPGKLTKNEKGGHFPNMPMVPGASKKNTPGIQPGIPTGDRPNRQATTGPPGKSPGKPPGHQANRQANRLANRQAKRWAIGHSDWWLEK